MAYKSDALTATDYFQELYNYYPENSPQWKQLDSIKQYKVESIEVIGEETGISLVIEYSDRQNKIYGTIRM